MICRHAPGGKGGSGCTALRPAGSVAASALRAGVPTEHRIPAATSNATGHRTIIGKPGFGFHPHDVGACLLGASGLPFLLRSAIVPVWSWGQAMDIEAEIHNLKRRVGDLEGAVNVLTGQISAIQPNIVALRDQSTESFNRVEGLIGRLVARVDTLNSQVWSLRDDLPELMNAALRESRTRND